MAYRADIEIGVKGAQSLEQLRSAINQTARAVDSLNEVVGQRGRLVQSIQNYTNNLDRAAQSLKRVGAGTEAETKAVREYVQILGQATTARERQNNLIQEQIRLQETAARTAKLAAGGIRENPNQYAGPIGPGAASAVTLSSKLYGRLEQLINQQKAEAQAASEAAAQIKEQARALDTLRNSEAAASAAARQRLTVLAEQRRAAGTNVNTRPISGAAYATPAGPGGSGVTSASAVAASAAVERQVAQTRRAEAQAGLKLVKDRGVAENYISGVINRRLAAKAKELELEKETTAELTKQNALSSPIRGSKNIPGSPLALAAQRGGGMGGRLGGAISGSIIGGAFPLLFGQGGGAAAGGAIGGLVGGLAGPGGSFAGSLLGTLLGDIASRGQAVKQLADDIGFSAQQTKQLSDAFKVANTDVEKFTGVIQNIRGVGLAIEDQAKAIQLVTRLTEAYGGSFEKTGNAITSTLESGKVTQATLNQLTSQGINIQQALADKYNVSRTELLQMAKDGEISAQSLIDTLVEVANAGTTGATKIKSSYEETATAMYNAFANATTGINNSFINTQNTAVTAFDRIVKAITPALVELSKITGQVISLGAYAVELGVKFASAFYAIPGAIQVVATALGTMIPGLNTIYTTLAAIRSLTGGGGKGGLATSLNLNTGMDGANWPAGVPRPGTPAQSFQVPSEFGPTGKDAKGPKPPEDRTAQLQEELEALRAIGEAEDRIRDALFSGREILALSAEEDKTRADIERDRAKAILKSNYLSEQTLINQIAQVRIEKLKLEIADKERAIRQNKFQEELQAAAAVRQSVQSFVQIRKEQEFQAQYAKTYNRLVTEGMLPAEAERIANYDKMIAQQLDFVAEQIKITDLAILKAKADGLITSELEKQLKIYKDQQKAIKDQAAAGPGKGPSNAERLQDAIAATRGELNNLLNPANQVIAAAEAIGNAFSESFKGVMSGAMSAQEALASFFQSVADHFLDMAAQMIAKWIQLTILNSILKLFPSGPATGAAASGGNTHTSGAGFAGGFSLPPLLPGRAKGGSVSGGSPYIVGERGPELFVPGRSGIIVPNDKMGGGATSVVVNVDASGSKVQGDDQQGNQLGRVIAAAIQQELIKQKRPGGLLV